MKKITYLLVLTACFVLISKFLIVPRLKVSLSKEPIPTPVISTELPLTEENLWSLIQDWRTKNGLQTYTKDQKLCDFAELRVKRVAKNPELDKFKPGNHYLLREDLYAHPELGWSTRGVRVGENVSNNHIKPPVAIDTLNGWLYSEPHRKTLESDFKYSCLAVEGPYSVQIFSNL